MLSDREGVGGKSLKGRRGELAEEWEGERGGVEVCAGDSAPEVGCVSSNGSSVRKGGSDMHGWPAVREEERRNRNKK